MAENEVGPVEPLDNDQDPGPDIESSQLPSAGETRSPVRSPLGGGGGKGKITFGGDVEREQANVLGNQMMKSIEQQLGIASEHIRSIRWVETDGSKHIEDPNTYAVMEFEIVLSSGKRINLTGPIINLRIDNV
jgi:hypothetical protein